MLARKFSAGIGLAFGVSATCFANDLYVDVSEESLMIRGEATHSSRGLLYFASGHFTEDKGEALSLGLMKTGQVGNNADLTGGLGVKGYAIDTEIDTVFGLGLGGRLTYELKQVPGLSLTAEMFYAPSIAVSDEVDDIVDFHVRANYALFENGAVYGGVRQYLLDDEFGSSYKFDTGPFVGIQLSF